MVERNEVLHRYRVQGQSKRQIAQEMHISRHTVDKIVWEYERVCLDSEGVCDMAALETLTGSKPVFNTPERGCRVVTDEMKSIIKDCLEDNRRKRATGMRKLQMNNKDIHALLLEKGFGVSYASVCNHVARISGNMGPVPSPEVFIRREHPAGEECEFDWGEVPLVIAGQRCKFQMAVFTLQHSNRRSAWLFPRQDTLALMEAHRNFFSEVGGVPRIMVYDNMKVAVTVRKGGRGRPSSKYPTKTMQRLSLYYGFTERFCNARSGWEKGSVERAVEIVRHEAFVSRQSFNTLAEAQAWLERTLERVNSVSGIPGVSDAEKRSRIAADMEALTPAPQPMGCFEAEEHRTGKYCTVTVDSNNYSVPETLVGRTVTVKLYSNRLIMMLEGSRVAEHVRLDGRGLWSMQLEHYLGTFLRKPGALDSSTALRQVPRELAELYRVHFCPDNQRDFIAFMMYARDNGILHSQITAAARSLRQKGVRTITADHLKVELGAITDVKGNNAILDNDPAALRQSAMIEKHADDTLLSLSAVMNGLEHFAYSEN